MKHRIILYALLIFILFILCSCRDMEQERIEYEGIIDELLEDAGEIVSEEFAVLEFGETYEIVEGVEIVFHVAEPFKTDAKSTGVCLSGTIKNATDKEYTLDDTIEHISTIKYEGGGRTAQADMVKWLKDGQIVESVMAGEKVDIKLYSYDSLILDEHIHNSKEKYGYVAGFFAIKLNEHYYYIDYCNQALKL